MKCEMKCEVWWKVWCSECNIPNWVCDGDLSDLTKPDIEAIECWNCGHSWWTTDDTDWLDMYPEDATPGDYAEKGREQPK